MAMKARKKKNSIKVAKLLSVVFLKSNHSSRAQAQVKCCQLSFWINCEAPNQHMWFVQEKERNATSHCRGQSFRTARIGKMQFFCNVSFWTAMLQMWGCGREPVCYEILQCCKVSFLNFPISPQFHITNVISSLSSARDRPFQEIINSPISSLAAARPILGCLPNLIQQYSTREQTGLYIYNYFSHLLHRCAEKSTRNNVTELEWPLFIRHWIRHNVELKVVIKGTLMDWHRSCCCKWTLLNMFYYNVHITHTQWYMLNIVSWEWIHAFYLKTYSILFDCYHKSLCYKSVVNRAVEIKIECQYP